MAISNRQSRILTNHQKLERQLFLESLVYAELEFGFILILLNPGLANKQTTVVTQIPKLKLGQSAPCLLGVNICISGYVGVILCDVPHNPHN